VYIPSINLEDCPLSFEEISEAIISIPGAERFRGHTEFTGAFKLTNGGMVLIVLFPGMSKGIFVTCVDGHPEEFGEVATALARRLQPMVVVVQEGRVASHWLAGLKDYAD